MHRIATSFKLARLRPGWSTRTLAGLLLCALVLRALVPTGFMFAPSKADPGTFTLTICSASSSYRVVVPDPAAVTYNEAAHHSTGHDQTPAGIDHQLCGFAVASSSDVPPNLDAYVPAYVSLADVPAAPVRDLVTTPAQVGPQLGSRAPPVTV